MVICRRRRPFQSPAARYSRPLSIPRRAPSPGTPSLVLILLIQLLSHAHLPSLQPLVPPAPPPLHPLLAEVRVGQSLLAPTDRRHPPRTCPVRHPRPHCSHHVAYPSLLCTRCRVMPHLGLFHRSSYRHGQARRLRARPLRSIGTSHLALSQDGQAARAAVQSHPLQLHRLAHAAQCPIGCSRRVCCSHRTPR